jgi:hypothetical protein
MKRRHCQGLSHVVHLGQEVVPWKIMMPKQKWLYGSWLSIVSARTNKDIIIIPNPPSGEFPLRRYTRRNGTRSFALNVVLLVNGKTRGKKLLKAHRWLRQKFSKSFP